MNRDHIDELINKNRIGILIKLIKANTYNWSVNDFQYIFDQCIENKLYNIFYFMMDHFIRSDCISFHDNGKYMYCVSMFVWICINNHIDMAKYLLSDEVIEKCPNNNPCTFNNFGLRLACSKGHINIVKYLLSNKVTEKYPNIDPCAGYNYGLKSACSNGHINMVEYLLSDEVTIKYPNIDPCAQNNYGLRWACQNGHVDMVEYLILDEVIEKYPKLQPENLDEQLKIDIEKLLDYRI